MIAFTLSPLIVAAILAASLAVVVLLYLLRPPARRRHVSSNLIWQRVLDAYRRVSDRWRWWLSLLIASLVCASIVLAVVRPGSEAGAAGKGKVVLVIDNAPTMATISSSGKERFEIAKERAVTLIKDFSPATQVMVVDTQRRLTTPEFVSPRQAVETVQSLQLGQSFRPIVPSAIASIPAERRYVVTDGVLLGAPPPDYVTVSVFEAAENLGITAFDFDNVPGNPAQREAFVEVFNAGNQPVSAEVVISGLGKERISRKVSVPAHGYTGQTFDVSAFPGGPIRAALTATGDAYRADDVAYGYLSSRRSVHVVLVTNSGGNYLSKSLSAQPRVHLKVESPRRYMDQVAAGSSQADIYVFDRVVPKQPPPRPALLIGARPASWLPPSAGEVKYPEIAAANLRHPVLRDISLRDLYIERGDYLKAPQDDTTSVLLRTDDDRVLAIAHDGLPRWVLVGFDVANSNFGLLPAFPVFLGNTINWLADEPEILRAQPGMIPVPFQQARVVAMDGSELPVVNVDKRSFFDATQPGLYTAIGKDRPIRIAVNLLERRISDVNRTAVATATTETAAADGKSDWPLGLSALLLILAAALLCVEWVAYHRRVTV